MIRRVAIAAALVVFLATDGRAQEPIGTAFAYQGRLMQGGVAVTGMANFEFTLWDMLTGGQQVGVTVLSPPGGDQVDNGLFTVELDFNPAAGWIYDGTAYWLEIRVEYPVGSGFWETLAPRQRLTAAPYASFSTVATAVPWAGILDVPAGFADGIDDDGEGVFWSLSGNAGTTPGTNFLGTTDDTALELHVNGMRALRLEPGGTCPNLLGGDSINQVAPLTSGATIGGGGGNLVTGQYGTICGGISNTASEYGAIGGGRQNVIEDGAEYATISGGGPSDPGDPGNTNNRVFDRYGAIGGGGQNRAGSDDADSTSDQYATVAGGFSNFATEYLSTVAGGGANIADNEGCTVGGGTLNEAAGMLSTIAGGAGNEAYGDGSAVGGGDSNDAYGSYSTIAGGFLNFAAGDLSTVAGGYINEAYGDGSTVGGGTLTSWTDCPAPSPADRTTQFPQRAAR